MRLPGMKKIFYMALLASVAIACQKQEHASPVPGPINDARTIRLKEMVCERLPSPYFQFTYDNNNYVTELSHASGLLQYELQYENGRLVRMINNTFVNKDTLVYRYQSNRVSRVDLIEGNGQKTKEAVLSYDDLNRLEKIEWKKLNSDFTSTVIRKLIFTYNRENNITEFQDYRDMGNGLELLNTHYFENYDTRKNPEANFLIKDVFEHFLFLPQVQLQKSNPLMEKIVGVQNDWQIVYNYTYNDNGLPVTRTATVKQTRGAGMGGTSVGVTNYSY